MYSFKEAVVGSQTVVRVSHYQPWHYAQKNQNQKQTKKKNYHMSFNFAEKLGLCKWSSGSTNHQQGARHNCTIVVEATLY